MNVLYIPRLHKPAYYICILKVVFSQLITIIDKVLIWLLQNTEKLC